MTFAQLVTLLIKQLIQYWNWLTKVYRYTTTFRLSIG